MRTVSGRLMLMGILASTHRAPSFSSGRNSLPIHRSEKSDKARMAMADRTVVRGRRQHHWKPRNTQVSKKRAMKLCFSFTLRRSSAAHSTGTRVRVKISAPSSAKPSVHASGANILPSTFSKLKMGMSAVMMMSLLKNTATPVRVAVRRIRPSLLMRLNRSMPTRCASWSRATKIPSTITTAPSMMMPKSMAPRESRLAFMPFMRRQKKAKSRASGMMMETTSVVRQSAMNSSTMAVTRMMPSTRLCITVSVQYAMSLSRS